MASGDENLSVDEKVQRSAARSLANTAFLSASGVALAGWASLGLFNAETEVIRCIINRLR